MTVKHIITIATFYLGIVLHGCIQNASPEDFTGEWICTNCSQDCFDLLILNDDKTYQVLNDCYSIDRTSIVESGRWKYDTKINKLTVTERNTSNSGGYFIWADSPTQDLRLKFTKDNTLELSYISNINDEQIIEVWRRK